METKEANTDLYKYRPIKFRAWSTKFKKFMAEGFHVIGECTLFDLLNQHSLEELDTLKIQEWAGCKDKNENDIYEGDILEYMESLRYLVSWDDIYLKWTFNTISGQDGIYTLPVGKIKEAKVIGNIFETPHILTWF